MDFSSKRILARAFFVLMALTAFAQVLTMTARAQTINYDLETTSVMRIKLPVSQAVTVLFNGPVGKIVAADPAIADAQPITDSSLYLVGRGFGTTTINLYSSDNGAPLGLLAVEIGVDTADMNRAISEAVPSSNVTVATINGRVRLSGTVADADDMEKVLAVVSQYGADLAVVNTVTLAGVQQVNLEVRILEAQRTAGRQLGIRWGGSVGGVSLNAGSASGPASDATSFSSFITQVISGSSGIDLTATLNALETKDLVRTLAEPNLTTLSGVEASFLAGGQVPIRVADANGNLTLNYRDFGVRLVFTPNVLNDDRIQIRLTPEVSGIGGFTASGDPVFNARTLDATVELRDGQSFAVAGLLQGNTNLSQDQLPWIGDVPVLGSLFKSSSYQKQDTEMVVIVTPRLVRPSPPDQRVATPLDSTLPANDFEFFALGELEVTPEMIKDFTTGDGVGGPFGYIIDLGLGDGE